VKESIAINVHNICKCSMLLKKMSSVLYFVFKNLSILGSLLKGTVQRKLTGVESDINQKVFLSH
jgi:hypothetical protein